MLKDSIPIRNLSGMINALRRMDRPTFMQHVSKSRNDFANLAYAVDERLGYELAKLTTRDAMLRILELYVKSLERV